MKIETKFDVKDKVYYLDKDGVKTGIVKSVQISASKIEDWEDRKVIFYELSSDRFLEHQLHKTKNDLLQYVINSLEKFIE